jgi:hypothetical protein
MFELQIVDLKKRIEEQTGKCDQLRAQLVEAKAAAAQQATANTLR